jgi:hypothetical protein
VEDATEKKCNVEVWEGAGRSSKRCTAARFGQFPNRMAGASGETHPRPCPRKSIGVYSDLIVVA